MPKRLLHSFYSRGGISHYTYCLAEALASQGDEMTVLTTTSEPYELAALPHHHKILAIHNHRGSKIGRLINPVANLFPLLSAANGSDIVHYQWPVGPLNDKLHWGMLKRLGKKIVYTAHDVVPHEAGAGYARHSKWLYDNADVLIVHGDRLSEQLVGGFQVDPARVRVVPHGNYNFMSDAFQEPSRDTARKHLGYSDDERVILCFGLIRPYKGVDVLIDAFAQVRNASPKAMNKARLLIVGVNNGNYWETGGFEKQIETLGLSQSTKTIIDFVPLSDIALYFRAADIISIAYKSGSQSGVLQLAFAFGKPAIVSNVGSIGEAVTDGETALVVNPGDSQSLAQALARLLYDDTEAKRIGANGRAYATDTMSWTPIAQRTKSIYDELARK